MIEHKRSLSTTSCTPIEEEVESLEELDWLLPFDQGCKFTAKERMIIKRRASEMEITPNMKITAENFQSLIFDDFDDMGVVSKEKVQKIVGFKLKNMWEKNNIEKEQEQSRPTVQSLTKQIVGANLCI